MVVGARRCLQGSRGRRGGLVIVAASKVGAEVRSQDGGLMYHLVYLVETGVVYLDLQVLGECRARAMIFRQKISQI